MDKSGKKPIIGILGGIGSGKSTVAAEFAKLGCKVIDADKIAHELLEEKKVKEEVVASFGQQVLDSSGNIDRKKLAYIVFSNSEKYSLLNGIVHPLILEQAEQLIEQYHRQNQVNAIVLDMPLLLEVGWDKRCDRLIFVDCDVQKRGSRVKKMRFFNKNHIKTRENFQISLDTKAGISDNTIDNNSDFSALVRQVKKIFSYIVNNG
jgi:dephospho-CoA kinase